MKNRAIVSERGTVTIPESIRRVAHIKAGDLVEFCPQRDRIILKHLIVKHLEEETFMTPNEWDKFDKLLEGQLNKGRYTSYSDLEKARQHSRNLLRKTKRHP